jgi:hypothetical protein
VVPVNCGPLPRWWPAILPCEVWRAARCRGGIAELVSDIAGDGAADGAMAGGGADAAGAAVERGPELYGVNPGPPGFGPGVPTELPPGLVAGCAQAGAEIATAAISAAPDRRCFMLFSSRSVFN